MGSSCYRRTLSASTLRTMTASILQQTKGGGGSSKGLGSSNLQTNAQLKSSRPVSVSGRHRAPLHSIQQKQSGSQSNHCSTKELGDVNDGTPSERKEENIWAERMHTVWPKFIVDLGVGSLGLWTSQVISALSLYCAAVAALMAGYVPTL